MEKIRLEMKTLANGLQQRSIYRLKTEKYMTLPKNLGIPDSLIDKEGEAEIENNALVRIIIEGKEYTNSKLVGQPAAAAVAKPKEAPEAKKPEPTNQAAAASGPYVGAPYNFIPLNDTLVKSAGFSPGNRYHPALFSGRIELAIETKTPLYIRGVTTDSTIQNKDIQEFFAPGGRLAIPGSSLRGMVRTLLEIASHGTFSCDDRRLYYRAIGDTGRLGDCYRNALLDLDHNCRPKVQAGYLRKQGNSYYIRPCEVRQGTQYYRVNGEFCVSEVTERNKSVKKKMFKTTRGVETELFTSQSIWFLPEPVSPHTHYDKDNRPFQLDYALIGDDSIRTERFDNALQGTLVATGAFASKKHMQWILNLKDNDAPEAQVPRQVVQEYRADTSRDEKANLLEKCKGDRRVPCFYLTRSDGIITAIGHTAMFRLPYEQSVHQHLPAQLKSAQTDYAQALFGKLEKWSSRLFFEEAWLNQGQENVVMDAISPKILSTPKPTTFQHYLTQPKGSKTSKRDVNSWNDSCDLRGYKLYWHRDTNKNQWSEGVEKRDKQHTVIKAVNKGKRFTGIIHFENLTEVELGALLFVLDLPEGCCHKLGMGKPLGLGSIAITTSLEIDSRTERYQSLFNGAGWRRAVDKRAAEQKSACIKAFDKTIMSALSCLDKRVEPATQQEAGSLWETSRMKMLKTMLNFKNTEIDDWNEKTRYMEIERGKGPENKKGDNEYRQRKVLPNPLEVSAA